MIRCYGKCRQEWVERISSRWNTDHEELSDANVLVIILEILSVLISELLTWKTTFSWLMTRSHCIIDLIMIINYAQLFQSWSYWVHNDSFIRNESHRSLPQWNGYFMAAVNKNGLRDAAPHTQTHTDTQRNTHKHLHRHTQTHAYKTK